MPEVVLIAAVARGGVIGASNDLPWYLPADLRRFRELTVGNAVVMGRKTYESVVGRLGKPLPDRVNIVVTRDPAFEAAGAVVVHSLAAAFEAAAAGPGTTYVIGGAEIYAQALPFADRLQLTEVEVDVEGDAYFPPIDAAGWKEVSRESHLADERNPHDYAFVGYSRVTPRSVP